MKFVAKEVVRGISLFEGNIDGDEIKSGTVHVDVALDAKKGGKGFRTEAMKCATTDVVKAIAHNSFPLLCELECEHSAGKKGTQIVVLAVKPIQPAQKAA
jgi:hypothetical protein